MKYALVQPDGRVAQIENVPFPVDPSLKWIECADDVTTTYTYENGAFVPPPAEPGPTAKDIRDDTFRSDPVHTDMVNRLRTATPAQIDTWVDNNLNSLADARTVVKAILKVLSVIS